MISDKLGYWHGEREEGLIIQRQEQAGSGEPADGLPSLNRTPNQGFIAPVALVYTA